MYEQDMFLRAVAGQQVDYRTVVLPPSTLQDNVQTSLVDCGVYRVV
jgi:hypothetical protein